MEFVDFARKYLLISAAALSIVGCSETKYKPYLSSSDEAILAFEACTVEGCVIKVHSDYSGNMSLSNLTAVNLESGDTLRFSFPKDIGLEKIVKKGMYSIRVDGGKPQLREIIGYTPLLIPMHDDDESR